ncbi:MAG TPA: transporter substrate-binding domain-containing protein [Methanospirillum sp.]|nr:transporter substrate-binding domain-containing protein [Methanospirillum sp.]
MIPCIPYQSSYDSLIRITSYIKGYSTILDTSKKLTPMDTHYYLASNTTSRVCFISQRSYNVQKLLYRRSHSNHPNTWYCTDDPASTAAGNSNAKKKADKLAEILSRGTLVSAVDVDYPPSSELVKGAVRKAGTKCAPSEYTLDEFKGFNIDVTSEVARQLGVEACYVTPPRTQTNSGNWADRWDIYPILYITKERLSSFYFTQPTFALPSYFYVHSNNTAYKEAKDLSGKRIGACVGCAQEQYLKGTLNLPGTKNNNPILNATILTYNNEKMAIDDLSVGDGVNLDAILTSDSTGSTAIKSGSPIKQLPTLAFYGYVAPAIDKKSGRDPTSFVQRVTGIIQGMHTSGMLYNLSMKYFIADITTEAGRLT